MGAGMQRVPETTAPTPTPSFQRASRREGRSASAAFAREVFLKSDLY
jgi:hypothetical protein